MKTVRKFQMIHAMFPLNKLEFVMQCQRQFPFQDRFSNPRLKAVQDQFKKAGIPAFPMTADQMSKRVTEDAKWIGDLMAELGMTKK